MTAVKRSPENEFIKNNDLNELKNSHASPTFGLRRQKLINISEKLMTIIGVCGQTLFYFQAYKIYAGGSAQDVSVPGFCFAFFSLISWLFYGLLIKNKVLIIVNAFAAIGAFLTLLAIYMIS